MGAHEAGSECGRRAFEHPWRGGTVDLPRPVKVIEVSERADAISRFPRITFPTSAQNPGDRLAFICSVELCIGPTDSECRSRAVFSRVGIGNRLGARTVPAVSNGCGKARQHFTTRHYVLRAAQHPRTQVPKMIG